MKLLRAKKLILAGLLAPGLLLPAGARAADECSSAEDVKPKDYAMDSSKQYAEQCKGKEAKSSPLCKGAHQYVWEQANEYVEFVRKGCEAVVAQMNKLSDNPSMDNVESLRTQKEIYLTARSSYKGLSERALKVINDTNTKAKSNITSFRAMNATPPAGASPASIAKAKSIDEKIKASFETKKVESFKNFDLPASDISGLTAPDMQDQARSIRQEGLFIRRLAADKEKRDIAITNLDSNIKIIEDRITKSTTPPDSDTTTPPAAKSAFDPATLAALAGPLAGLAAAAQQKSAAADSSLSGMPPTSPTPDPTAAAQATPPATSKFAGSNDSSKTPKDGFFTPEPKKDSDITPSGFGGGLGGFGSGLSGSSEAVSPGAFGGGGGGSKQTQVSANAGGGGGGAGGESGEEAGRNPGSQTTASATDDALQSFNGGGGGGLNFNGGSSTNSTSNTDEGGLKDMFHEMEAAVESAGDIFGGGEEKSSDPSVGDEGSDGLFHRVRACHVRNLKKGMVLNGLGEKIEESKN